MVSKPILLIDEEVETVCFMEMLVWNFVVFYIQNKAMSYHLVYLPGSCKHKSRTIKNGFQTNPSDCSKMYV